MKINFTKIQSCGNDYIYVNCLEGIDFDPYEKKSPSSRRFDISKWR